MPASGLHQRVRFRVLINSRPRREKERKKTSSTQQLDFIMNSKVNLDAYINRSYIYTS